MSGGGGGGNCPGAMCPGGTYPLRWGGGGCPVTIIHIWDLIEGK